MRDKKNKLKRVKYESFSKHLKQELSKDSELDALFQLEKIKLQMTHHVLKGTHKDS